MPTPRELGAAIGGAAAAELRADVSIATTEPQVIAKTALDRADHFDTEVARLDHAPSKEGLDAAAAEAEHVIKIAQEQRSSLSAEMCALSALDDGLVHALACGAIRLMCVAWLLSRPEDYRIQNRQELEQIEREGALPSPLLSPAEAAILVCQGKRAVGVLSYGWLSPGSPDPASARIRVVRSALQAHRHIKALF
jgi:hypothetical protein